MCLAKAFRLVEQTVSTSVAPTLKRAKPAFASEKGGFSLSKRDKALKAKLDKADAKRRRKAAKSAKATKAKSAKATKAKSAKATKAKPAKAKEALHVALEKDIMSSKVFPSLCASSSNSCSSWKTRIQETHVAEANAIAEKKASLLAAKEEAIALEVENKRLAQAARFAPFEGMKVMQPKQEADNMFGSRRSSKKVSKRRSKRRKLTPEELALQASLFM